MPRPIRAAARTFAALRAGVAAALLATPCPAPALQPPTAEREQTADQQVLHALNRLGFGPRPGDVERVRAMGVDEWIARQLAPERLPDAAGDALRAAYPALALDADELFRRHPPPRLLQAARPAAASPASVDSAALRRALLDARRAGAQPFGELQSMRVARAVVSERQLEEVLVDFWSNHFNVFAAKGPFTRHWLVAYERDVIRPHALGRFRDLLGAVAHSPAMLFYLDQVQSSADSGARTLLPPAAARRLERRRRQMPPEMRQPRRGLNENYARELLELHTLGVEGGYGQRDVIEVARALTGWSIEPPREGSGGAFVFRPALHDAGPKTVLGVALPAGRGVEDGEEVLDVLARHPSTARFIAGKLARRLVSDDPPAALVERAAERFRRTDGDIRAVVRTIVTSPEFFSAAAYRSKVKSPFELVVSALRAVGAAPDTTPRTAQAIARLGQPLYGHQAPDGWPERGEAWINGGAILDRINFGLALADGRLPGATPDRWPPARTLAGRSRAEQVDAVVRAILGGAASPDTRAVLLSGENPLLEGEEGRGTRGTAARHAMPRPSALAQIVGLALGSPEFQRR